MNRFEILHARASRGDDPKAVNLLAELDRYFTTLESETKAKISQHLNDVAYVISQPDALAVDSTDVPEKLSKIVTAWGKAIDPAFGDNSQIVNG
jgi:hypothetical protein